MRRTLHFCFSLLVAATSTASAHEAGTSFMKVKQGHGQKPHQSSLLFSHGGVIEQTSKVYVGPLGAPVDDVDLRRLLDHATVREEEARLVRLLAMALLDLHEAGPCFVGARRRGGGEEQGGGGE